MYDQRPCTHLVYSIGVTYMSCSIDVACMCADSLNCLAKLATFDTSYHHFLPVTQAKLLVKWSADIESILKLLC